jgi:hypothetical protein
MLKFNPGTVQNRIIIICEKSDYIELGFWPVQATYVVIVHCSAMVFTASVVSVNSFSKLTRNVA